MARLTEKVKDRATAGEAGSKPRPVRVDHAAEVHLLLRKVAAEHDVSMAAYSREWLEAYLREEAGRLGIKP